MTRALAALALSAGAVFSSACCRSLARLVDKRLAIPPSAAQSAPRPAAVHDVRVERETWHDDARGRDVPATIYVPVGVERAPVVVFSHGIGEDRDSYAYLGRALAARGYLAVHLTHAGTDKATLRRGYLRLYRATKEKENWVNRPRDVRFALDRLGARPGADLSRVAVAGHSAGAFTALALAGMRTTGGDAMLADPRVKVAVAISMPKMEGVVAPGGYDALTIPVLHMTGTCDASLIYRTFPRDRRIPFESSHAASPQYLVTLEGVNHDTFSNAKDEHHAEIAEIIATFLDAYLLGDPNARAWFDDGGLSARKGVSVERKPRSAGVPPASRGASRPVARFPSRHGNRATGRGRPVACGRDARAPGHVLARHHGSRRLPRAGLSPAQRLLHVGRVSDHRRGGAERVPHHHGHRRAGLPFSERAAALAGAEAAQGAGRQRARSGAGHRAGHDRHDHR